MRKTLAILGIAVALLLGVPTTASATIVPRRTCTSVTTISQHGHGVTVYTTVVRCTSGSYTHVVWIAPSGKVIRDMTYPLAPAPRR
jgi:hypothetical protein